MNQFDLTGKVAFINGGAGGIGGATTRTLAAMGAAVAFGDIQAAMARETERELTAQGHQALSIEGDGADRAAVDQMVQIALERFGRIDIAVNIVGRATAGERSSNFWEEGDAEWDWLHRVNVKSAFYLTRAVAGPMKAQGGGKIILLAADLGRTGGAPSRNPVAYVTAKAGVIAFTKSIARELGPHGITVNAVSPGYTDQPDRAAHADAAQPMPPALAKLIPLGRRAVPQEQADAIAFLASPAADFITGQIISVNGGLDMPD